MAWHVLLILFSLSLLSLFFSLSLLSEYNEMLDLQYLAGATIMHAIYSQHVHRQFNNKRSKIGGENHFPVCVAAVVVVVVVVCI